MRNKKIAAIFIIVAIMLMLLTTIILNLNKNSLKNTEGQYKILTSFYPLYIMTLNITNGAQNIKVSNMADKITGCIHDYTLSTADLKKFENTDVFIQNGAGLESFSQKIVDSYPNVKVINCASSIQNLIVSDDEEVNGHVWLGVDNYELEVNEIATNLSKLNPENSELYRKNLEEYLSKIDKIKTKFSSIVSLNGKNAICLNESLEYLLKELNINAKMIQTDHDQASLSAETIKNIITDMKEKNTKMIFIDKNDDSKTADTLAIETGAKVYRLDSEMTGEEDLNAYINAMDFNYNVLKNIND